jgi:hypothetical protein
MPISSTFNPSAPSATSGQGSAVLNRESLDDQLTVLEPQQTPVQAMLAKGTAKSTFEEWGIDSLSTPSTEGVSEDADVTSYDDKFANVARVGNYVQKFRRTYKVTEEQNAVDSAGPLNLVKAESKAMLEIKRDIEAAILSDNEMQAQTGAGVPYKMRGLGKWILNSAQAVNPVPSDYRTPTGSILAAAPTEITLNDVLASIFTESGEAEGLTMVAGTTVRKRVAEFTRTDNNASETVYNVTQEAKSKTVTLSVQLFESDFGFVRLVNGNPACMPSAATAYILNPKYLELRTLKGLGLRSERQENAGSGERGYVAANVTLVCKQPQAHGKISY